MSWPNKLLQTSNPSSCFSLKNLCEKMSDKLDSVFRSKFEMVLCGVSGINPFDPPLISIVAEFSKKIGIPMFDFSFIEASDNLR